MVAFLSLTRTVCPSCRVYPCIDGTGCVGQWGQKVEIVPLVTECPARFLVSPRFEYPHPKRQEQPRSPRRGFKKGKHSR